MQSIEMNPDKNKGERGADAASLMLFLMPIHLDFTQITGVLMPRKKNDLSLTTGEKEQIKLMIADGNSFNAVAHEIRRDPKTVKRYASVPEVATEITQKQKGLADSYQKLAERMLDSITDADISHINAYQRTVSAGIATDKLRLLTDQSTENIAVIVSAIEDMRRRRREQG